MQSGVRVGARLSLVIEPIYKQSSLLRAPGSALPSFHPALVASASAPFSRLRGEVSESLLTQFVEGLDWKTVATMMLSPSLPPPTGMVTKKRGD